MNLEEIKNMNIDQIEARMSAIASEIDTASGETLTGLENEVRSLNEQRELIKREAGQRQALRTQIAEGKTAERKIEKQEEKMEEKRTFAVDTEEYRAAWLKNLQGKPLDAEERTAVSASAAIPTTTMNMIIHKLEEYPMMAAVDVMHIPGHISFPVESTCNDASWVAMGTASTDSEDALTSVSLGAYKLIKTVSINADVQAMAIPAFEAWLVARLANKIAKAASIAVLNGGGVNSNCATGILVAHSTNDGTFTKAAMKYKDITTIIGDIGSAYRKDSSFCMNSALFYGEVLGMTDSTGRPVVVADPQAPAKYNLLGFPVIVDDNCTTDVVLFGDFKQYKFNFAKDPTVEADDSVGFRTGDRCYRAMALADGKLAVNDAFVRYARSTAT